MWAAIGEDDVRRAWPEARQRCEHRVVEVRILIHARAVKEDVGVMLPLFDATEE